MMLVQLIEIDRDTVRALAARVDPAGAFVLVGHEERTGVSCLETADLATALQSFRKAPLDPRRPVHVVLRSPGMREQVQDLTGIPVERVPEVVERTYDRFVTSLGHRPRGHGVSTVLSREETVSGLDLKVLNSHVLEARAATVVDAILAARFVPGSVISGTRCLGRVLDAHARAGILPPGGRVDVLELHESVTQVTRFESWAPGRHLDVPVGAGAGRSRDVFSCLARDLAEEAAGGRTPEADLVVILGDVPGLDDVEGQAVDLLNRACRHLTEVQPAALAPGTDAGPALPARFARLLGGALLLGSRSPASLNVIHAFAEERGLEALHRSVGILPVTQIAIPLLVMAALAIGAWRGLLVQGVVDRTRDELAVLRSEMPASAAIRGLVTRFQDARWQEVEADARLDYLDELTGHRPDWVEILNTLAHQLPGQDIAITHVVMESQWPRATGSGARFDRTGISHGVQIHGEAVKLNGVTEFIRRLNTTDRFEDLQIERSEKIEVEGALNDRARLFEFAISGRIARGKDGA